MPLYARDKEIIRLVAMLKQMTAAQIGAVISSDISRQMVHRVLSRLVERGWLIIVGGYAIHKDGTAPFVYTPSEAGWREAGLPKRRYRKPHEHIVETAEMFVRFAKEEHAGRITGLVVRTEVNVGQVRADMEVRFTEVATGVRHAYYVEVEVCKKDKTIIEGKCSGYVAAWSASQAETFPYVLLAPTHQRDVPVIEDVINELPATDRPLFKLARADQVIEKIIGNVPAAQASGSEAAVGTFTAWA